MLTYTSNKYKGGVMLPILKEKNVTAVVVVIVAAAVAVVVRAARINFYCVNLLTCTQ